MTFEWDPLLLLKYNILQKQTKITIVTLKVQVHDMLLYVFMLLCVNVGKIELYKHI